MFCYQHLHGHFKTEAFNKARSSLEFSALLYSIVVKKEIELIKYLY